MWTEKLSYARMHAQTKFSIEHTSVELAHTRPINRIHHVDGTVCALIFMEQIFSLNLVHQMFH